MQIINTSFKGLLKSYVCLVLLLKVYISFDLILYARSFMPGLSNTFILYDAKENIQNNIAQNSELWNQLIKQFHDIQLNYRVYEFLFFAEELW